MNIFAKGWSHGFDGPGRRFVYYLKGCNFHCLWCGNPESIAAEPEMMFYPDKSRFASQSCAHEAVKGAELDRATCRTCGDRACIDRWRDPAFELAGCDIPTAEIIAETEQRRALFGDDGGVTFSGGEPTLQMDALLKAAKILRQRGIHVAVETNASSPRFSELPGNFDLLICDLKCVTPELHRRIAGTDNSQVLANLASGTKMTLRVPLIAELNFIAEEREKIYDMLMVIKPETVEFLRLHQLGLPKYRALGQVCQAERFNPPTREQAETFCQRLRIGGIAAQVLN